MRRARKPAAPPSKNDLAERDRYAKAAAASLANVRTSAQTWRTGLTAFITLVTTGVVIKGRGATADLDANWRTLITVLIGGGLLLAVVGLWQALAAEAGTDPKKQTLQDIRAIHGSLDNYEVFLAGTASRRLQWGIRAVAVAVAFLLLGIAATWWAPTATPSPPAYLRVTSEGVLTCGTLQSADGGQLRLIVTGSHEPVVVPLAKVTNLGVTATCS
jgi:hypothetical protein